MLARIPMRLFREWGAYYSVDPFGEERGDLRAALPILRIVQMFSSKHGAQPQLRDFMPEFSAPQPVRKSPEELLAKAHAYLRQREANKKARQR